ncbi:hypothetical protein [Streptomyces violascens]|uniref:hypothetical protein n=1 Tax=Streptomyces violascens TaxID=67381 RepID=UPI00368D1567
MKARRPTWAPLAPAVADLYVTLVDQAGGRCTCIDVQCGRDAHDGGRCPEKGTDKQPLVAVHDNAGALVIRCQPCASGADKAREADRAAALAATAPQLDLFTLPDLQQPA